MTREKEALQAAADIFKVCSSEFDKAIEMLWIAAFIAGVDYADEHPKNVWHDASEEPAGDDWVILCEDDSGNCFCQNKIIVVELFLNWQKSAEKVWLKRWAYVSDLLPKGGEE